jgi:hypothetical protein
MGGSVAGYRLVVDKNFPTATAIIGDSTYVETYETVGGQVSVTEPSILGTQLAFYGYMAWLVLEPTAFVQFTVPPPIGGLTAGNGGTQAPSGTRAK